MHTLNWEYPEYSFLHTSLLMTVLNLGHGSRGNVVSGAEKYYK